MKEKSSKTIYIVSYALEVSENGVMCVCSPFSGHQTHLKVCKLA